MYANKRKEDYLEGMYDPESGSLCKKSRYRVPVPSMATASHNLLLPGHTQAFHGLPMGTQQFQSMQQTLHSVGRNYAPHNGQLSSSSMHSIVPFACNSSAAHNSSTARQRIAAAGSSTGRCDSSTGNSSHNRGSSSSSSSSYNSHPPLSRELAKELADALDGGSALSRESTFCVCLAGQMLLGTPNQDCFQLRDWSEFWRRRAPQFNIPVRLRACLQQMRQAMLQAVERGDLCCYEVPHLIHSTALPWLWGATHQDALLRKQCGEWGERLVTLMAGRLFKARYGEACTVEHQNAVVDQGLPSDVVVRRHKDGDVVEHLEVKTTIYPDNVTARLSAAEAAFADSQGEAFTIVNVFGCPQPGSTVADNRQPVHVLFARNPKRLLKENALQLLQRDGHDILCFVPCSKDYM